MASSTRWNSDDLRRNAHSWTLEGDAKLLEFMQTISENLEKRAQDTNCKIGDMVKNLQETSVSLETVTNKLSALQHSQFVENRVYEDDETIANISEVPVDLHRGKEEYNPIETLNKVLNNSISMMNNCYQKVSIDVEDSDDEEGLSKSIVYKPKNVFEQHPLPHIIGSKEWKEKWHVGLCDTDDDYSDEENQDEYSDTSENASLSASLPSNAPTISESESSVWGLHPKTNIKRPTIYSPSSDEEASSNTVTSKTSSDEARRISNNRLFIPPAQTFPPQDQKYYVHNPKQKSLFDESSEESDHEISNAVPQPKIDKKLPNKDKIINTISNIFSDEPPDLDEVDKKDDHERENNELFYDSELESSKHKKNKNSDKKVDDNFTNIKKKTVNLFDDDDFDTFMKELDKRANEKLQSQNAKEKGGANLFADVNEEEQVQVVVSPLPSVKTVAIENDFQPPIVKNTKSLFDSEPEDNIFESITNKSKSVATSAKTMVRNLFDDESSDDDFESIFKSSSKTGEKNSDDKIKINNKDSNLGEAGSPSSTPSKMQIIDSSLPASKSVPPLVFDEPPQDDDLFNKINQNQSVSTISTSSVLNDNLEKKKESSIKSNISNLFSDDLDDDDDNLFASSRLPPVPAPRVKVDTNNEGYLSESGVKSNKLFSIEESPPFTNVITDREDANKKEDVAANNSEICANINKNDFVNNNEDVKKLSDEIGIAKTASENLDDKKEETHSTNILSNVLHNVKLSNDSDIFSNLDRENIVKANDAINNNLNEDDSLVVSSKLITQSEHSIVSENNSYNSPSTDEKIANESRITPISSKFKLPSLFDDEPPDDDNLIFSNSSITTDSVASYSENISCIESDNDKMDDQHKVESLIVTDQNISPSSELKSNSDTIEDQSKNVFTKAIVPSTYEEFTKISKNIANMYSSEKLTTPESQLITTKSKEIYDNDSAISADFQVLHETDSPFQNNENNGSEQFAEINNASASSIYSTINLFQDIPPEDDFQTSGDVKRLHNIFYDDFAETITTATTNPRRNSTNYFFSDEPPPDSFDDDTIGEPEKEYNKMPTNQEFEKESIKPHTGHIATLTQTEPDNKGVSVAELIKKVGTEQLRSKPKLNTPAPKKLNTNLNINVGALIPGAKRPNTKRQSSIEKDDSTSLSPEDISTRSENYITPPKDGLSNSPTVSSKSPSDSSRLINLNKTRAKIQSRRRPSTRKGRQESYKKSLLTDVIDGNDENQSSNDAKSEEDVSSPIESPHSSSNRFERKEESTQVKQIIISEQIMNEDWLTKSLDAKQSNKIDCIENAVKPNVNRVAEESDDDLFGAGFIRPLPQVLTVSKEEKPKHISINERKTTQSIFQDDSDDDLFGNREKSKKSSESSTASSKPPVKTQTKIFSSDEDDDDIFSKSFKPDKQSNSKFEKNVPKTLSISNNKSLFGDDDDDEDDDLFGSSVIKSKASARIAKVPKNPEKKSPAGSITGDNPLADLLNG